MRNIKLLNGLLWVLNGLMGAGIVVFAFLFLIFPQESSYLRGFDPAEIRSSRVPDRPVPLASDEILKRLVNPIEKGEVKGTAAASPTNFRATLTGVIPSESPGGGAAFLRLTARNIECPAFPGEPISYDGKPVDELAGWKLSEVHRNTAVFTNGNQRQVLTLETEPSKPGPGGRVTGPAAAPGARVERSGQPYQAGSFGSQVLSQSENQQVWAMDPQEIDWAFQNQDRIIDQDFQVAPIPGGGLKIENVQGGSIGAARGLMTGDIVKNVNGIPLNSLTDVKNLLQNPAMRRQAALRLTVERAGKTMVLMYQPLRR